MNSLDSPMNSLKPPYYPVQHRTWNRHWCRRRHRSVLAYCRNQWWIIPTFKERQLTSHRARKKVATSTRSGDIGLRLIFMFVKCILCGWGWVWIGKRAWVKMWRCEWVTRCDAQRGRSQRQWRCCEADVKLRYILRRGAACSLWLAWVTLVMLPEGLFIALSLETDSWES